MTFVVPFDGTPLAKAALRRATEFGSALDEDVLAITIVPERTRYAREKGWIEADEPFDVEAVVEALERQVEAVAPRAEFTCERIREFPPGDRIADRIERIALQAGASVMFLGSDNVGRVVTPLTSVGVHVAADEAYDVYIVRHPSPPTLDALDAQSPDTE
ncbi:MAG: universal stress protein [Halobacteriota archaeon]